MEDDWFLETCYTKLSSTRHFAQHHSALVNVYRLLGSFVPCRRMCATICQMMILVTEAASLGLARRDIL